MGGFVSLILYMGSGYFNKTLLWTTSLLALSHLISGCDAQNIQSVESHYFDLQNHSIDFKQEKQTSPMIEQQIIEKKYQHLKIASPAQLPDYALPLIGRFEIELGCDQHFIPCTAGGEAKVLLSFLPDGKLHRSLIQYGKLFKENIDVSRTNYDQDRWFVNPAVTELSVIRADGLKLYYEIVSQDHLILNLDKVQLENAELFALGLPEPTQRYELKRAK